ncbi:MAG: cyclic nucleotide-binding domain-containing protein [Bauldia sp.]|uniref:Crp/Fnr family transcriptional regulator n=1 Tax=Bauldia sp. TaxID=2575872 RepID=UPI001DE4E407|nr:cyclic nucleotide-binding domain-containing protein [Bauldia sp.]MCB1496352.1 cyclic nucleotide-binding domain-containing protein [Bauldia sp.]
MNAAFQSLIGNGALIGHASYILLIVSMLMTRMFWLRVMAIGSGLLAAIYSMVWVYDPVSAFWELMFVLTNVGQLAIQAFRNRKTSFTAEERAFHEVAVPDLEPAQVRRLLKFGRWVDAEEGTVLTRQGELAAELVFIVEGKARVEVDERPVGVCGAADFVGEISVSTGMPATATVTATSPIRYLAFERSLLRKLLDRSDEISQAVEQAFRHGIREKLIRTNTAVASSAGPVPD